MARLNSNFVRNRDQTSLATGLEEATLQLPLGQVDKQVTGMSRIRRATKTMSQVSTGRAVQLPEFPSGYNIAMGYGLGAMESTIVLRSKLGLL